MGLRDIWLIYLLGSSHTFIGAWPSIPLDADTVDKVELCSRAYPPHPVSPVSRKSLEKPPFLAFLNMSKVYRLRFRDVVDSKREKPFSISNGVSTKETFSSGWRFGFAFGARVAGLDVHCDWGRSLATVPLSRFGNVGRVAVGPLI